MIRKTDRGSKAGGRDTSDHRSAVGEDITEDVFLALEENADLNERRQRVEMELGHRGHRVFDEWLGQYTKAIAGMKVLRKGVPARRTGLARTYSKLC